MATQQLVYMAAKFGKFRSPRSRLISDAYAGRNQKQPLGIPEWLLSYARRYRQSTALPSPPHARTESPTLLAEGSPMFQSGKQKRSDCRTATISQSVGKKEMKVTEKKEMEEDEWEK